MRPAIIGELQAAFDATTVLTGADIDARYHTEDFIQTNPWLAVSIAAGVGFVFGALFARR